MEALTERILTLVPTIEHVESIKPLLGGACQENFQLQARVGGESRRLVLRSDAPTSLPGSLSRRYEFEVIGAARELGVNTPAAHWLTAGLVRPEGWAYFLDWVEGIALGGKVVRSPDLEEARGHLPGQLATALAQLHSPLKRTLDFLASPQDPVQWALEKQRRSLDRLPQQRPALELVHRWLQENAPKNRPVCLVHGDFRVGNFLVGEKGLQAVLDWEFAHLGDPLEDLAWLCLRDWRFGRLDRPAGGLCSRQELARLYHQAGGEVVSPEVLHFWEVMGNLRWGCGAQAQGLRFLEGGEPRLELLVIARRVAEMEYEALRLIETGPESW